MKKTIVSISIIIGLAAISTSCEKYFEDAIATPNNPTQVTPALLLANIEVATFANFGGQLARQTQMLMQQAAGTTEGSQTTEIMNYNITELTNENEWGVIYNGVLMNGKLIVDDFGEANPHYAGIAKVIMAMNLGCATDLWGAVPFSQALNGLNGNLTPEYDTQQQLLDDTNPNSIFALLDQAIADLQQPASANAFFPGSEDFVYGGDVSLWIKAAYSLKARYYNRLSQVDGPGSATKALDALANGKAISSTSENAMMMFGTGGNSQNQWYAYEQARPQYIKMGKFFVNSMVADNDPRLPFYADQDTSGNYSGTPKDSIDQTFTSDIGDYLSEVDASIPLISYAEMKFIEAEAQLRASSNGDAATAHNDAVMASVMAVTGAAAPPAFVTNFASEDGTSITLEKIMYQKYAALFGQIEVYNDWRRTGFPALTPATGAQISSIPVRLILPQNERLYNPSAVQYVQPLTAPVYWDKP